MRCTKNSAKRDDYSNKSLLQEIRKTLNKQTNLTPKATRQEEQKKKKKKLKVSRRKEIIKIRAKITKKEMKETTQNINKTESWLRK